VISDRRQQCFRSPTAITPSVIPRVWLALLIITSALRLLQSSKKDVAFVEKLVMSELGFERAKAAETGRPGYDPRDLLKLYLYGYLNQIRSSRRLESECRRNVELMWLLGRLYPDHKSIAEFRRMHCDAVTAAGADLLRFVGARMLIIDEVHTLLASTSSGDALTPT